MVAGVDVVVGNVSSGYSALRLLGSYSDGYAYIQAGTSTADTSAKLRISRYQSANYTLSDLQIYSDKTYISGNVGIGTTAPAYKLHVYGSTTNNVHLIGAKDTYGGGGFHFAVYGESVNTGAATGIYGGIGGYDNSNWVGVYGHTNTAGQIAGKFVSDDAGGYAIYSTGGKNYFGGNIGIGTTAPVSLLELYKTDASPILTITSATSTTYSPQIAFRTGATPTTKFTLGVDISTGKLKIVPSSDITTSTGITIDSSGNVGIGTTAPSGKLSVYMGSGWGSVHIGGSNPDLWFDGGSDSVFLISNRGASSGRTSITYGNTELFTVLNTGNVGIGTTAPGEKLTIAAGGNILLESGMVMTPYGGFGRYENRITYSEQFDNSNWGGYCGTKDNITANTTDVPAPDGTIYCRKMGLYLVQFHVVLLLLGVFFKA